MSFTVSIPEGFFAQEELSRLKELFGLEKDEAFQAALNGVVLAGLKEYRDMFLGDGLPSRADEIRQFRLLYLILYHFQTYIPNELEISTMFQIPESRSRSLIRYVIARFRHEIEKQIVDTVDALIKTAQKANTANDYHIYIGADNMYEEINRIIHLAGSKYRLLTRVLNESHLYVISADSLAKVREYIKKYKK